MNLISIIKSRGLKQTWLAKQLGLKPSNLNSYLKGSKTMPLNIKRALYKLLGINTEIKIGEKR